MKECCALEKDTGRGVLSQQLGEAWRAAQVSGLPAETFRVVYTLLPRSSFRR
ncbi:hypothetical protein GCM10012275_14360 [Longimycelium tulufanense]|uniref:Uncharacterized protein n=1 Tax=Longimycelium tulufanense TaxID=907463 RepID=A0A8J3FUL5_9PSEU|nr:hypothetical protein [Longimycelium tulufanense]GGM44487.1 hypothetical protein GCM10012275_14360 [Longimycelium tulufanense]